MSFYDDASWLLIPSGIKEDVVFAQKPTSGLGDLTFTRASDATYTDSTGVVRRSPYNLLQFSEMYTDAYWTKTATVTANTDVAPNGTLTADTLTDSNSAAFLDVRSSLITIVANRTHTTTCFIKKTTGALTHYAGIAVLLSGGTTRVDYGIVNTTTGTVLRDASSNVNSASYSIQDSGNYWRVICTFTDNQSNTNCRVILYPAISVNGTSISDTATGSNVFWGAQLVEGTSALDYFPTTNRQDVPRIDFRNADGTLSSCGRLLLEPQRTNSIRNSSMVGAVAGTPGTLPTNWVVTSGGLTQTIVGTGTESGVPYIDIRLNGTANNTFGHIRNDSSSQIAAANGQVWSYTFYSKIIAQPSPALNYNQVIFERTSIGTLIKGDTQLITLTSNLQRFNYTKTLNGGATVGAVDPAFYFNLTNGATYDFTIRIAAPQMELGGFATTWVPTTTAAVTRIKDDASKTGVSSIIGQSAGTIFWDINDLTGTTTSTGNPDFGVRNTAFTNWIGITTNSFASPFRVVVRPTSGSIIDYTANITIAKAAVAWSSAGAVLYVNGAQVGTSATNPNFSFDTIQMLGGIISYKTNQAALFPTRLSNAELAQLTTL